MNVHKHLESIHCSQQNCRITITEKRKFNAIYCNPVKLRILVGGTVSSIWGGAAFPNKQLITYYF